MKKFVSVFLVFSTILLISGCATLFKGTKEEVAFHSEPQGADVYVNGVMMGSTPLTLKLESKKTYAIEFKKEGYPTSTHQITNHVGAGWIVLDILGGLLPIIVDAATGAWYKLDQNNVNTVLRKQQPVHLF